MNRGTFGTLSSTRRCLGAFAGVHEEWQTVSRVEAMLEPRLSVLTCSELRISGDPRDQTTVIPR